MKIVTLIFFHSYGNKPCPDGVISAYNIKYLFTAETEAFYYIPNDRTLTSFNRFKAVLENEIEKEHDKINIIYVDCSPSLDDEIEYLLKLSRKEFPIHIYEHHQLHEKFKPTEFDEHLFFYNRDICAAKITFGELKAHQQKELGIDNLLDFIQFSEYESEKSSLAGGETVDRIVEELKGKVTTETNRKTIEEINDRGMFGYYVLDLLMLSKEDWSFLYETKVQETEKEGATTEVIGTKVDDYVATSEKFSAKLDEYIKKSNELISGTVRGEEDKFTEKLLSEYLKKLEKVKGDFKNIKIIENLEVGGNARNVGVYEMDIFQCGRSMEPLLRENMKEQGTDFSIIMNKPTKKENGEKSYYFSLRRRDDSLDCKDLVAFFKDKKITEIAGGHPHASGATLNEEEYKQFRAKYLPE